MSPYPKKIMRKGFKDKAVSTHWKKKNAEKSKRRLKKSGFSTRIIKYKNPYTKKTYWVVYKS